MVGMPKRVLQLVTMLLFLLREYELVKKTYSMGLAEERMKVVMMISVIVELVVRVMLRGPPTVGLAANMENCVNWLLFVSMIEERTA